ncbi:MAG: helix-turn-helix transcriptional regulator [Acidobacteria bacterium]|nr:helix-turn-helix transcriptional regulator [Acidobacteriota bacterium]
MDQRVQVIVELMKADPHKELSLDELSRAVNLSASRLRHVFKAEMGMSPARYMKSMKMNEARVLTENTFLNVKQIMSQVGLSDESHFVRDFKKFFGVTPMQCRARRTPDGPRPAEPANK